MASSAFAATLVQVFESHPGYSGYRVFGNENKFRVDFECDCNDLKCESEIVEAERKPYGFNIRCGDLHYMGFGIMFECIWAHMAHRFRAITDEKCQRWNRVNTAMQSLTVVMGAHNLIYTYDDNRFALLMRDGRLLEFVYSPSRDTLSYTYDCVTIVHRLCDFYRFADVASMLPENGAPPGANDYMSTRVPVQARNPVLRHLIQDPVKWVTVAKDVSSIPQ